ncbi:MAG: hypothetical protein JNL76_04630 [Alphaproteobacteria bacterium]|nr:hypothetical protein [Alphaproteobacteria bacterium]
MVSFAFGFNKKNGQKPLQLLRFIVVILTFCSLLSVSSQAQTAKVGPGCDPEFMKAMQQKAWMEAQREIMITQATIAKPDTVFSLGCFGNFTSGFEIKFGNDNNYDYKDALDKYVKKAFNHTYGGGHYSGANNSANTRCEDMQDLWNAARGANLDQPSKLLGTLQDIATYDRGAFPKPFPAPSGFGSTSDKTTPLGRFYGTKEASKSVGAAFNDMNLFAAVTAPVSQVSNKTCSKGIATGLSFGDSNPEIICPNPGCVSDGAKTPKCCDYKGGGCSATYTPPTTAN